MYEAFGGVPVRTVCDNLKTGVVKHPREGEIILTDAYESLGLHHVTAIMPAGVRKPIRDDRGDPDGLRPNALADHC